MSCRTKNRIQTNFVRMGSILFSSPNDYQETFWNKKLVKLKITETKGECEDTETKGTLTCSNSAAADELGLTGSIEANAARVAFWKASIHSCMITASSHWNLNKTKTARAGTQTKIDYSHLQLQGEKHSFWTRPWVECLLGAWYWHCGSSWYWRSFDKACGPKTVNSKHTAYSLYMVQTS